MPSLLRLYHALPLGLRSLAASLQCYRLSGSRYGAERDLLVGEAPRRDTWSSTHWKTREERLECILRRAAASVPYYREQWAERRRMSDGASPNDIKDWPRTCRPASARRKAEQYVTGYLDKLYGRLPILGQHMAVTTFGLYRHWVRFGRGYKTALGEYLTRETGSGTEMRRAVEFRTRRLLEVAACRVPYYRTHWTDSQKGSAIAGRLTDLPLLDKEPVRADPIQFLDASRSPWPRLSDSTSGSTGMPVRTYWTLAERREATALREARSLTWAGVSYALPRATFSGRLVEPDPESRGPYYRYNAAERQVYLSAFHLQPDTARFYVQALRRHSIQWLNGYAVSFYLLGQMILDQHLSPPPLKAIVTTSEKLTREMREVMVKAYGCRIYEEYSSVENAMFAGECEHGRLHVSPDAGVVETLREDGTPCGPGEVGEVVATCLFRTYQPLIRYRIGDLAVWDDRPCPCNRPMPVLKEVVGRLEDVVVGLDGRQMVRFHGIFVDQPHIREGQIVQEGLDRILVKIVPAGQFGQHDEQDVIERVRQRLGSQVAVSVQLVDSIPRTKAGKFQAVVSMLKKVRSPDL